MGMWLIYERLKKGVIMKRILVFAIVILFSAGLVAGNIVRIRVDVPDITDIAIHGKDIFLLSSKEYKVYVYSMEGKLKKKFGRKGEGPGEFKRPGRIFLLDGKLYVNDLISGRFQVFDLEGNFIKSINFQHFPVVSSVPFENVIFFTTNIMDKDRKMSFKLFRKDGGEKEIESIPGPVFRGKDLVFPPESYPALLNVGGFPVVVEMGPARVKIYDRDGKLVREFNIKLPQHEITEKWKRDFLEKEKKFVDLLKSQNVKLRFRKKFPRVERLFSFGKCFVLEEWTGDSPYFYHIYDLHGKEVKEIKVKKEIFRFYYPYRIDIHETDEGNELILEDMELPQCKF